MKHGADENPDRDAMQLAFAKIFDGTREALELGMEPQALADRLGPVIDKMHEDILRLKAEADRRKAVRRYAGKSTEMGQETLRELLA